MKTVKKVFAYIIRENKLLVFKHPDHADAGIQVPAGTVEENESLENAVIREASEETGLSNFKIEKYLGNSVYHVKEKDETHDRYYFLLSCMDKKINRSEWIHGEKNELHFTEIDKRYGMIRFSFYWLDIFHARMQLNRGHSEKLNKIPQGNMIL
jgi:8-oxo-dGTP pyrophosphatase MutT (NUDIX family)